MSEIPPELQRPLDEYLASLPWYKRWPLQAALAAARMAGGLCLIIIILLIILIFYLIWKYLT